MLHTSMIDVIGHTPLVLLQGDDQTKGEVYAKLELLNPFGMKDRVAKQCILAAKRSGELRDGAPIIESSSGTMACGVALVGTYLGHEVHIVTDPRMDAITVAKLTSLGCHIHVVDKMGAQGWQSARLERLSELLAQYPGAYWPRQYDNPENPAAYAELAHELISELGRVDILIASVGSGGSLSGTAKELKKHNPNLKVIAVDAAGSVIFGQPDRPGRLQGGLGNSLIASNVDHSIVDEVHWLNDEEAFAATLELAKKEKIFAGNSSGSVYAVANWVSGQVEQDTKIVAIFPDRGDRYTDTIYNADYRLSKGMQNRLPSLMPNKVSYDSVVGAWSYASLKEGAYKDARQTSVY
ncbi:cysteine synthase family protein [Paenibacillus sp. sgz500958]|uniref:cysteine synthase family protein n=1 Tax=Paenibacillus sp. sgz500958 TaxID=3242475 RepID=UPI0036D3D7D3